MTPKQDGPDGVRRTHGPRRSAMYYIEYVDALRNVMVAGDSVLSWIDRAIPTNQIDNEAVAGLRASIAEINALIANGFAGSSHP